MVLSFHSVYSEWFFVFLDRYLGQELIFHLSRLLKRENVYMPGEKFNLRDFLHAVEIFFWMASSISIEQYGSAPTGGMA